jgi:hypothetical protein
MINRNIPIILILLFALVSCGGGGGPGDSENSGSESPEEVMLERLSDEEFNALSEEDKFAVSNKVMGALFKGLNPDEFFDLGSDVSALALQSDENYLTKIEQDLSKRINENGYRRLVNQKYEFDEKQEAIQYQLALLYEVPVSKNYLELWMAYQLANTILFSPAVELDSVANEDARAVFERLVTMIRQRRTIREIVYEHMISQENWRRFRSPEDNTREMMEIFLRRFIDTEVPLAAQACKNWSLIEEDDEYTLVIGDDRNSEPVEILDTTVVDCLEFYDALANHADLIPTVVSRIVDVFFAGSPAADRQHITDDICKDEPDTFNAIFVSILFSKEFLVYTERPKQFEEALLGLADRIGWYANKSFFKNLIGSPAIPIFQVSTI